MPSPTNIHQERTSGLRIDNVATCMMLAILPIVAMMKFAAILAQFDTIMRI